MGEDLNPEGFNMAQSPQSGSAPPCSVSPAASTTTSLGAPPVFPVLAFTQQTTTDLHHWKRGGSHLSSQKLARFPPFPSPGAEGFRRVR